MKKPAGMDGATGGSSKPSPGKLLGSCEELWKMLTDDVWDDGTPRVRATLLILCDGGCVKLWLNDKAAEWSCWFSGESLEEALIALEAALYSDSAGWRVQKTEKRKK